jgi:hypothetical protein
MDRQVDCLVRSWPSAPIAASEECLTFVKLCRKLKWRPLASQVTVGSTMHRAATRVDLVCRDEQDRFILLEIKCGYPNWYKACSLMEGEFPNRNDCPANQAQVQLALTHWMFCCTYPQLLQKPQALKAFVVKLNRQTVDVFPLESWALAGVGRLVPRLAHR